VLDGGLSDAKLESPENGASKTIKPDAAAMRRNILHRIDRRSDAKIPIWRDFRSDEPAAPDARLPSRVRERPQQEAA
jgi:hypothetical protein